MPTFDGDNLLLILDSATPSFDVLVDFYSDWKEWMKTGGNAKYPILFETEGGRGLSPTLDAGSFFYMRNDLGWRIRPAEEDATVNIEGQLAAFDVTLPLVVPTVGAFTVLLLGLQPLSTVNQSGVSGLTAAESAALLAIEDGVYGQKIMRDSITPASLPGYMLLYDDAPTPVLIGHKELWQDEAGTLGWVVGKTIKLEGPLTAGAPPP